MLRKIYRALAGNLVIFDVGANIGKYAELVLSVFEDIKIALHCFEPSAKTFELLESNTEIADKAHIILNNFALGSCHGRRELYSDQVGSGLASLTKRRLEHFGIDFNFIEICEIDTLDEYCGRNNIDMIDLLKIDVEGHELDVLEGSRAMLKKAAIKFIQFEFGGCDIDTRIFIQDFFYFFKPFDFEIYRITPSGYCQHLPIYKEVYEQFITTNFLAVHRPVAFTQ